MQNPRVSVIVPNYNYAKFLDKRIESILNQSFKDYELILLDDASTDNSVEILKKYIDDQRITHLEINKTNTGSPFQQWMKGIMLARGEWIWIAEADDLSDSSFLETSLDILSQNPNAVACYSGSYFIDSNDKIIPKEANYWGSKIYGHKCINGKNFAEYNLYWSCCIMNTSSAVFKRDVATNLRNKSFLSMHYAGDWLFWFQMALCGDIVEIYSNLNLFRQHDSKVTNKAKKTTGGIEEDIYVTHYMEECLHSINNYKKRLNHGLIYRKIYHSKLDEKDKYKLFKQLEDNLGGTKSDFLFTRRINILRLFWPWLITSKRDRLKNKK